MSLLIFFEGLPGSGKSTVIKRLKKELGDRALIFPKLDIHTVFVEGLNYDYKRYGKMNEKVMFYLEAAKEEVINNLSTAPDIVLFERSYVSLMAYNYVLYKKSFKDNLYWEVLERYKNINYKYEHIFIYLQVSVAESLRRDIYAHNKFWHDPSNLSLIKEFYEERFDGVSNCISIDTETNSISDVMHIIKEHFHAIYPF
jgi:thymidylate kinase